MNPNVLNKLRQRKRRILDRIENHPGPERDRPMIAANNIHYQLADRVQGLGAGGIGAMLLVARISILLRGLRELSLARLQSISVLAHGMQENAYGNWKL